MRLLGSIVIVCVALFAGVSPALAHNPRAEVDDWGNFDAPYIIADGTVSYALFGALGEDDDVDIFRFDFEGNDSLLRLRLFVPVCSELYEKFNPKVLILGPAAGETALTEIDSLLMDSRSNAAAVEEDATPEVENLERLGALPDGLAVVTTYDTRKQDEDQARPTEYEWHTQRDYYLTPTIDYTLEATGSYYLVVYDPDANATGRRDYLLSAGYKEIFFRPQPTEPESVTTDYNNHWPTADC